MPLGTTIEGKSKVFNSPQHASADLDKQLEKTLNGANRAIFLMKSIVLDKKEYRCQVTTYKNIINMIFF